MYICKKKTNMSLVDFAYQTVQTILNKNSRAVLSPERFNILATQSQYRYFANLSNEYRDVLNKKRLRRDAIGVQDIEEQLSRYLSSYEIGTTGGKVSGFSVPTDFAFFTKQPITYDNNIEVAEVPLGESAYFKTNLVAPTLNYPQYKKIGQIINLYPSMEDNKLEVLYYRNPVPPKWTYNLVVDDALFNPSAADYADFDISERRIDNIILDILEASGLHLRDVMEVQVAQALKNSIYAKDKQ